MHGTFYFPANRTLVLIDPWRNLLVDPDGNRIGWDGEFFTAADGTKFNVSPRDRGRIARAGIVENTRGL